MEMSAIIRSVLVLSSVCLMMKESEAVISLSTVQLLLRSAPSQRPATTISPAEVGNFWRGMFDSWLKTKAEEESRKVKEQPKTTDAPPMMKQCTADSTSSYCKLSRMTQQLLQYVELKNEKLRWGK